MKLISIKDELYEVIRLIPEHTGIDTEKFRISTNSTNVFRKDGMFWFVRLVEEAQIIEEEQPIVEENLES
jgi:TPP-dependent indolepyruvate ferredoxin oxidoreductase alpha subunit